MPRTSLINEYLGKEVKGEGDTLVCTAVSNMQELYSYLKERISKENMDELYYDVEHPLIFILSSMEAIGFNVNREKLDELAIKFKDEIATTEKEIFELCEEEFNINSPKQLGKILFEKLVKSDSDIDFMIVPMKTKEYYSFIKNRKDAYNIYRDALLDIQEINQVFVRSQQMSRRGEFRKRLERGLISQRLQTIAQSYWVEEAFLNESPSIIADKIISHLPPLMENIRNYAFEYIKSEEERISQLLK